MPSNSLPAPREAQVLQHEPMLEVVAPLCDVVARSRCAARSACSFAADRPRQPRAPWARHPTRRIPGRDTIRCRSPAWHPQALLDVCRRTERYEPRVLARVAYLQLEEDSRVRSVTRERCYQIVVQRRQDEARRKGPSSAHDAECCPWRWVSRLAGAVACVHDAHYGGQ
eukprot:867606-Prymnesium_polylepis.2